MTGRNRGVALLLCAGLAAGPACADDRSGNHGYAGAGFMLMSNTMQTPLGDLNSTGGGLVLNGAAVLDAGGQMDFGVTGGMDFAGRTDNDSNETISEVGLGFDGGVIIADIVYVSLGLQVLNQTPDSTNVTTTYAVVPLGLGVMHATGEGYWLAQLRFGSGELSNDQDSSTEDIDYFGIRLVGQAGAADGIQFMGGLEFDSYDYTSVNVTDGFFRLFVGLGFGG